MYSNFGLSQNDSATFTILVIVTILGYFVIFEAIIITLLISILVVFVFYGRRSGQIPIENVILLFRN